MAQSKLIFDIKIHQNPSKSIKIHQVHTNHIYDGTIIWNNYTHDNLKQSEIAERERVLLEMLIIMMKTLH